MRWPPMAGVNASLRQAGVGQLERVDNAKKSTSNRAAEYQDLVGADRAPLRRQKQTFMQSLQEVYRRSQPLLEQLKMSAIPHHITCRHQRRSGHQHHVFNRVAGQHAANETITRSQLGVHHRSYRCS